MEAQPYLDADLPDIKAALARWACEAGRCGYCHPGDLEHRIHRERDTPRPAFVWYDEVGLAGVEIAERFGHVFDLFVRPDIRGGDVEVDMLEQAASRSDETDVFACDAPRIEALERLEFEQYRAWDHIRTRPLDDIPPVSVPTGFVLRAYGGDLAVETGDTTRAAFTTIWFDDVNKVGLFEPVGTEPAFLRLGLARAVMTDGLRRMREAGMHTALVEHDIANEPAAALYASLGFTVAYETVGFHATPRPSST